MKTNIIITLVEFSSYTNKKRKRERENILSDFPSKQLDNPMDVILLSLIKKTIFYDSKDHTIGCFT